TQANQTLIDHYRNRIGSSWLGVPEKITDLRLDLAALDDDALVSSAESILNNQLTYTSDNPLRSADGGINWTKNPTSNREWLFRLNRHQWWTVLGLAYTRTNNERYAKAFVSQMLDWIDKNPPPKYKDETSPTWRLMEVALRMRISWIPVYAMFYSSPSFGDDAKLKMLRAIYDHAKFLTLFTSKLNHLIRESNGLVCVGIYFSEYREAQQWREMALYRLEDALCRQINQDGSQIEVSTGYQWLVIDEFEQTYDLLENNRIELPKEDLREWIERMYHVLARMIRPDGSFPEINDGFILYSHERLMRAGEKFTREDYIYSATAGERGIEPHDTSTAIRDAGIYIMRSDWSRQARYLLFDAGPYGGFHGHEDKLNIELFAYGQSFIVDSGSYTYEKTDPYRKYFVGSQGHNTVLVDGLSQIRRWHDVHRSPKVATKDYASWVCQEAFDYVAAQYNEGYGKFELKRPKSPRIVNDVVHTRHVLFVKPDYWVIVDELQASKIHDYQLLFHCSPQMTISESGEQGVVLNSKQQASRLHILPASPQEIDVSCVAGQERPIQGWYSVDHHHKTAAPVVIYKAQAFTSKVFITLLYPSPEDEAENKPSIKRIEVPEKEAIACTVETKRGKDFFLFSNNGSKTTFGPYASDAILAGVRTDLKGITTSTFEWRGEIGAS
ncbi:MAG: hypothetical protein GY807_09540, partial [Gammaproteobacteria bacterium]|nr:hypothetical protein [Gammaproteobacteria bacterium]